MAHDYSNDQQEEEENHPAAKDKACFHFRDFNFYLIFDDRVVVTLVVAARILLYVHLFSRLIIDMSVLVHGQTRRFGELCRRATEKARRNSGPSGGLNQTLLEMTRPKGFRLPLFSHINVGYEDVFVLAHFDFRTIIFDSLDIGHRDHVS